MSNLRKQYFDWMCGLVTSKGTTLTHRKLLKFLHSKEFTYMPCDYNRAIDGIDFRYRFGYEKGYDREEIKTVLDTRPCSVLEMMLALSVRVEDQIMDDTSYGNRTGQWFWNMIVSLGLGHMDDMHFDREYCKDRLQIFLERRYASNGEGGLFIVNDPEYDMRDADIWCQFMWYLNENCKFTID